MIRITIRDELHQYYLRESLTSLFKKIYQGLFRLGETDLITVNNKHLKIQLNTDNHITGNERLESYVNTLVKHELSRFSDHITRIEIHLADENGPKKGVNDIRCTLEARMEKMQPMVVTCHANTVEKAVSDALVKIKAAITTKYDRLKDHKA